MRIRPLAESDAAQWLRMRCALWPDASPAELAGELSQYLPPTGRHATFVAEGDGGHVCGFIELSLRDVAEGCASSPVGYIEGWYVDPEARRSGIGRALVREGEAWARAKGCTEMASDTQLENTGSEAAHVALGYAVTERLVAFAKKLTT